MVASFLKLYASTLFGHRIDELKLVWGVNILKTTEKKVWLMDDNIQMLAHNYRQTGLKSQTHSSGSAVRPQQC